MKVGKSISIGDICKSRYWLSFERKPLAWWRWGFYRCPTYNGTIDGIIWMTPIFVIIGHIRDLNADL